MNLNKWGIKWGIPFAALEELRHDFGCIDYEQQLKEGKDESAVQTRIRLEATHKGLTLWRNNVGATYTKDGSFLRYGLANDTKQLNKHIKSSDLIGIRSIIITKNHVGMLLGQFVAREVKEENWNYSATEKEEAQLKFLKIVVAMGGDGQFANKVGTL